MKFKALHHQNDPLLLCNVWDAASAKTAENLNFQAVGTSSAAIAAMLGYKDGEDMDFSELKYIVGRIIANISLPLTVDLESGYSREPLEIANHIEQLADLGVVGVNIEDSIVNGERKLLNGEDFAKIVSAVRQLLQKKNINIFINVRTDTYLAGYPKAVEETLKRMPLYEEAGADGLFIPGIENEEEIKTIVASTGLPINVMCMPNLPDFQTLKRLGVKRISMGNFLFEDMYKNLYHTLGSIVSSQLFRSVF